MIRAAAIAILVTTGLLSGSGSMAQDKPNVVCESDASGANMVCRDVWLGEDAAPFRRVAPAGRSAPVGVAPKPPLPMLAPPPGREVSASQGPAYLRKNDASDRVEPLLPSTPSPTIADRSPSVTATKPPAERVEPIAERLSPAPSTSITVQPIVTTPPTPVVEQPVAAATAVPTAVQKAVVATPAPSSASLEPSPRQTDVATPQPAPVKSSSAAVASVEVAQPSAIVNAASMETPRPATAIALLDGAAFRALDGSHYTLELANATSAQPLRDLAARLQLPGDVYLIHLRSPESDRWLLTWADHTGQSEARSARQQVPADAAINSGWPRRIAPLQNELVLP